MRDSGGMGTRGLIGGGDFFIDFVTGLESIRYGGVSDM